MTGICKAYDRNMQFRSISEPEKIHSVIVGIYLVHLFEVWHIFLRFGTD